MNLFLRLSIVLAVMVSLGALVNCQSSYDKPVYKFLPPIALQYFKCFKCTSYDGGIYGKGPSKHYRAMDAKKCIHQWREISENDFATGVNKDFNIDWSKDPMPFWQQLDKYTSAHQSNDAMPAPPQQEITVQPPIDEARQQKIKELVGQLSSQNPDEQKNAGDFLIELKAIPDIIKLLQDNDPYVRQLAVYALGELGAKEAIPQINILLQDTDSGVRDAARAALKALGVTLPESEEMKEKR